MTGKDDTGRPPGEERTVFDPNLSSAPGNGPRRAPAGDARQIRVGDVLNHIYEVRRFIARGGMGEVFEGVNVNTDEKVAIKVILRHLAADPLVQAMFRKEARLLTRLGHPGLVQYRVLAIEPQFGVFYIVTEYIDGPNLSERLADLRASPAQIGRLLRKLAQGLAAAHALGAVHRDISPDNVMLEGGRLEGAKIIDFGIAKDLNAAAQTIVGDGFAGKLNYVAPEQLGDYNRSVGPWTDVYSLGLTILAVALGRDVNMGATLVEAVDKRRAGVDLADAPADLRPVLERMLKPDPAERLRSMGDVLEMLDGIHFPEASVADEAGSEEGFRAGTGLLARWRDAMRGPRLRLALAGGVAALALGSLAATLFWRGGQDAGEGGTQGAPPENATPKVDGVAVARQAVQPELPRLPCSWLDLSDVSANGKDVSLRLQGVSGKSAEALNRLESVLKGAGLHAVSIDFGDVLTIGDNACAPVDAFSAIRQMGAGRMAVEQREFEMSVLGPDEGPDAGKLAGKAVVTFDLSGLADDVSIVGLGEAGKMQQLTRSKSEIVDGLERIGTDRYRAILNTKHIGWSGILMLTGKGPFPADLMTNTSESRSDGWPEKFLALARQREWKAEMVWYRTVDEIPEPGGN